jgi:hypothetical protein
LRYPNFTFLFSLFACFNSVSTVASALVMMCVNALDSGAAHFAMSLYAPLLIRDAAA